MISINSFVSLAEKISLLNINCAEILRKMESNMEIEINETLEKEITIDNFTNMGYNEKLPSWEDWTTTSIFKTFHDLIFNKGVAKIEFKNGYSIIVKVIIGSHPYVVEIYKDGTFADKGFYSKEIDIDNKMIEIQKCVKSKPKTIAKKEDSDEFFYHSKIDGSPIYRRPDGTLYKIRHDGKLIKLKRA